MSQTGPSAADRWASVRWLDEIDSTNRLLIDEARAGAPEGAVVAADHQTAGRGRLGRRWEAPPGASLLASVLLRPRLAPDERYACTAAVALAAADACADVGPVRPLLKWPNDLVVDDRKLAGVLAESDQAAPGGPPGSVALVVGIGLNVEWAGPPEAAGTSLRRLGAGTVDRRVLLDALLARFVPRYRDLGTAGGPARVLQEVRGCCATIGRPVRVEQPQGVVRGMAVGLSDRGGLLVDAGGRRVEVAVGDVVHLRPDDSGAPRGAGSVPAPGGAEPTLH